MDFSRGGEIAWPAAAGAEGPVGTQWWTCSRQALQAPRSKDGRQRTRCGCSEQHLLLGGIPGASLRATVSSAQLQGFVGPSCRFMDDSRRMQWTVPECTGLYPNVGTDWLQVASSRVQASHVMRFRSRVSQEDTPLQTRLSSWVQGEGYGAHTTPYKMPKPETLCARSRGGFSVNCHHTKPAARNQCVGRAHSR